MLEQRVARLEEDMATVKGTLGRLEPMIVRIDEQLRSTLPHLATKAELAEKPSKTYLWVVMGVMVTALVAATFGAMVLGVTVGRDLVGLGG